MSGIILSKEHGLNPSITTCFYCGEDCGLALFGAGYKEKVEGNGYVQAKAPMHIGVMDMNPCSKCEEYMKMGIIFISATGMDQVENDRLDYLRMRDALPARQRENCRPFIPNPHRTGGFWVLKEDAVQRMLNGPLLERVLKCRWIFIEDEAARNMGLFDKTATADEAEGHAAHMENEEETTNKIKE